MTTPTPLAQTPPAPDPAPSASAPVATTASTVPPAPAPTTATTTSTSEPAEPAREQDAPAPGGGVPWILLAAALTGLVAVVLAWAKARSEARARSRLLFAEAYQWYASYKEFPYAVRRRRTAPPETAAEERVRLSEAMREVQAKLDYFRVWTALADPPAGAAYAVLLKQCRTVAGGSIRDAWQEPGTDRDADMNIPPPRVDLSALQPYEDAYQTAVRDALRRWWFPRPPKPASETEKKLDRPSKTPPDDAADLS